jgi:hypothetical protein
VCFFCTAGLLLWCYHASVLCSLSELLLVLLVSCWFAFVVLFGFPALVIYLQLGLNDGKAALRSTLYQMVLSMVSSRWIVHAL